MPIYTFRCPDGQIFRQRLSIADYESVKAGEKTLLDENDNALELIFDPGSIGFVLKDGISGGWMSKAYKENAYRRHRYVEMGQKQKDHAFKTRLVPNYKGEIADRWSDVRDHVRSTKGAVAAATYDNYVNKERLGVQ
jgi:hypothetical protein